MKTSKPQPPLNAVHFDAHWRLMLQIGAVQAVGSAQYRRVRAAWQKAGRPAGISSFIAQNANQSYRSTNAP